MEPLYPLRFRPLFRRYIWGGRRLGDVLNKPIGEGDDYAESWEVVDHGDDQSLVAKGELAGQRLHTLMERHTDSLFGESGRFERFPLLFKLLDCQRNLSVQVHPNDVQGRRLDPPDLGKTEAWVILDAKPGSKVYAGVKRGFDRPAFEREIVRGTTDLCLHVIEPLPGDCIFVPAGTVHALGAGLLVAEIQQSSDTTFRIFDWNRTDRDGKPRPLHIDQALDVIDFQAAPVAPQQPVALFEEHAVRLIECDKFILDRWTISTDVTLPSDQRFHILYVVEGELEITGDPEPTPITAGHTLLMPAHCRESRTIRPRGTAVLLDMYLPSQSADVD